MSRLLCPMALPPGIPAYFQCQFLLLRAFKKRVGLKVGSGVLREETRAPGQPVGRALEGEEKVPCSPGLFLLRSSLTPCLEQLLFLQLHYYRLPVDIPSPYFGRITHLPRRISFARSPLTVCHLPFTRRMLSFKQQQRVITDHPN